MTIPRVALLVALTSVLAAEGCSDSTAAKPPVPTMSAVSAITQQGTVNQFVASKPMVRVTDASGQPVAGLNVIFTAAGLDLGTVITGADGTASMDWRLSQAAGTQTMKARLYSAQLAALGPSVSFTARALADTLAAIQAYLWQTQVGFPSTAVATPPVIIAIDEYSNAKPGVQVSFEVTGGGSVTPANAITDSTGRVSVGVWTLGSAYGTDTLIARVPNLAPAYVTVDVNRPFVVSSIVTGAQHTCAISNGDVYCWGNNTLGQTNPNDPRAFFILPQKVALGVKVASLSSSNNHTCAISNENPPQAYCWGANSSGQLGAPVPGAGPVRVPVADGLASVAAGPAHTCGLTPAGVAYCWGDGTFGQLGNGSISTCIITNDGVASGCAGPQPVRTDLRFVSLAAGVNHTCGLIAGGQAYCWGLDDGGQLGSSAANQCVEESYYYGDVPVACALVPQIVVGPLAFASVAAGYGTCALAPDGSVACFTPRGVLSLDTHRIAALASDGGCGLGTDDGQAICWVSGFDVASASLGTPAVLAAGTAFSAITQAQQHRCGILKSNGDAVCWGSNDFGQLGNGTTGGSLVPLPVASPQPSSP